MPAPAIPHVSPQLARSARDFFQHLYARPLTDDDGLDMATNVLGAFGVLREMQQRVDAQRHAAALAPASAPMPVPPKPAVASIRRRPSVKSSINQE